MAGPVGLTGKRRKGPGDSTSQGGRVTTGAGGGFGGFDRPSQLSAQLPVSGPISLVQGGIPSAVRSSPATLAAAAGTPFQSSQLFSRGFQNPGAFATRELGPAAAGPTGVIAKQRAPFDPTQEGIQGPGVSGDLFGAGDGGDGFGDGTGLDDGLGGQPPSATSTRDQLIAGFAGRLDPNLLGTWLDRFASLGIVPTNIFIDDATGEVIAFDGDEEIGRMPLETLQNPQTDINNQFTVVEQELDQAQFEADNAFKTLELSQNARIADLQAEVERERIEADLAIAESRFEEAITIQDRIDEREQLQRQLTREIENARNELQSQTIQIDRDRFEMEKLRFMTELSTTPAGLIDLANLSRGLPTVGAGGPIPGGFQRIGGASPAFSAGFAGSSQPGIQPFTGGGAPVIGDEPGVREGRQPFGSDTGQFGAGGFNLQVGGPIDPAAGQLLADPTGSATGPETDQGIPSAGGAVGAPLAPGESPVPLPPGLAAVLQGQDPNQVFGAAQLPPGSIGLLSDQELAQLTPLERRFYEDLIKLQGQRPEDFEAIRSTAGPFGVATSGVAA